MSLAGYALGPELGRGGTGVVHRARAPDGGDVAVKLLLRTAPEDLRRFEREARLVAALGDAEGFVPLLAHGVTDRGAPFLVMPFLSGGTLRARLGTAMPIDEAAALGERLARSLGVAHARGIVHRDLKPENVLFDGQGRAFVVDLGLAKHFAHDVSGASLSVVLSRTGDARGTVGYMAPEQLDNAMGVGPPADVFALGAILYECVTGSAAFAAESAISLAVLTAEARFEPLRARRPDAPRWLDAVVTRALAREPGARFADGAAFAAALAARVEPSRRGRAAALVVGALVAVAGGGGAAVVLAPVPASAPALAAPPAAPRPPSTPAPSPPPADVSAELLAALRTFRPERIARAARGPVPPSPEVERALGEGLAAAAARATEDATRGLVAVAQAGIPHGPGFDRAALAVVDRCVRLEIPRGRFEVALALVHAAAGLRLRFEDPLAGDLLFDQFYAPVVAQTNAVPRARFYEIALAFVRLDVDIDAPHLDAIELPAKPSSHEPDSAERFLVARVDVHRQRKDRQKAAIATLTELAQSRDLGPRTQAVIISCLAWEEPARVPDRMREALALDPTSVTRHEWLASTLIDRKGYDEAEQVLRAALRLLEKGPVPLSKHQSREDIETMLRKIEQERAAK